MKLSPQDTLKALFKWCCPLPMYAINFTLSYQQVVVIFGEPVFGSFESHLSYYVSSASHFPIVLSISLS
jgi:hypothetical protein